ncbi:hypothetical protein PIB30_047988 [Stylosanthes scabra]|uniref:FAR1 domain-containing protein n=1 Tax=Stylosanthes scabra TaxID=79078 RepID=A0ABU6TGJ7_9FABA|nr:hypothetical protein [Stylosanthes scabra]
MIQQYTCEVDEVYVPKVGMWFEGVEDAGLFYKEYAKRAGFSTKISYSNRCKETKEIKNQLITCTREGRWTSEFPSLEKTNPIHAANCPARIYVHIDKKSRHWCISKVILHHSHPCCAEKAQMLPQHRGQLGRVIKKDMRNYVNREVRNVTEEEDAKELGKGIRIDYATNKDETQSNKRVVTRSLQPV